MAGAIIRGIFLYNDKIINGLIDCLVFIKFIYMLEILSIMVDFKHVLALKPYHILAKPEDISDKVLVAGDPGRVKKLSRLLDKPRLVNEHRGYFVYTGYYNDSKISIACHGIGAPSAAIVFEELYMLGARIIIRLGTSGGLKREIEPGDIVIPVGAAHIGGGTIEMYVGDTIFPAVADPEIVLMLEKFFKENEFNVWRGIVASSDAFHSEEEYSRKWVRQNVIAVEMECATLFTLSWLKGFRSGAALLIIDNLATGSTIKGEKRSVLEKKAGEIVLNVLAKI